MYIRDYAKFAGRLEMKSLVMKYKAKLSHIIIYILMIAILATLTYALAPSQQIADSSWYFSCSRSFTGEKGELPFSLANFPVTYRGCLMPLLLFLAQGILSVVGIPAMPAIAICGLGVLLLSVSFILRVVFPKKDLAVSVFIVAILFLVFFRHVIVYALSDLYALSAAAAGVCALYLAGKLLEENKRLGAVVSAFLAGSCLYFAYNTRTIYVFTAIVALLIFVCLYRRKLWMLACIGAVVLGILFIGIPQMIINDNNFGVASLALNTSVGGYDSLFLFQLDAGLGMQRFDAIAVNGNISAVPFVDSAGSILRQHLDAMGEISYLNYFKLFISYPFQMAGIYMRHFLNMISTYFSEVYVSDFDAPIFMLTLGYTAQFLFTCDLIINLRKKNITIKSFFTTEMLYVYALILSGLLIVPGAVEGRFALPLYLVLFIYLVCCCSWKQLFFDFKQHWIAYTAVYLFIYLAFCTFWSSTLASALTPFTL